MSVIWPEHLPSCGAAGNQEIEADNVTHQDGSLVALNVTPIDDESSGSERGHQTTGDAPHLTARLELTDGDFAGPIGDSGAAEHRSEKGAEPHSGPPNRKH